MQALLDPLHVVMHAHNSVKLSGQLASSLHLVLPIMCTFHLMRTLTRSLTACI